MNDLATARAGFLAKVNRYASGESARFAPALDELIRWSEENGLEFTHHSGVHDLVKFSVPGAKMAFWSAAPRTGDGGKLTLLNDSRFPEPLRTVARDELARIDGKAALPGDVPEVAFTMLIWEPYRKRVLEPDGSTARWAEATRVGIQLRGGGNWVPVTGSRWGTIGGFTTVLLFRVGEIAREPIVQRNGGAGKCRAFCRPFRASRNGG